MPYRTHIAMDSVVLQARLLDVSAPSAVIIPITAAGIVTDVWAALGGAITLADSTVTIALNGTTIGTMTVAFTSSAAGSTFQANMTGSEAARTCNAGDYVTITTDGASSTTAETWFSVTINDA